jgi:hypothetical protein
LIDGADNVRRIVVVFGSGDERRGGLGHTAGLRVLPQARREFGSEAVVGRATHLRREIAEEMNHDDQDEKVNDAVDDADRNASARIKSFEELPFRVRVAVFVIGLKFLVHRERDDFENDEHDEERDRGRDKTQDHRVFDSCHRDKRLDQMAKRPGNSHRDQQADRRKCGAKRSLVISDEPDHAHKHESHYPQDHTCKNSPDGWKSTKKIRRALVVQALAVRMHVNRR